MRATLNIRNKAREYYNELSLGDNSNFISFFRITAGLILLFHFMSVLGDFNHLYGMNSVIPTDIHALYVNDEILLFNEIIDIFNIATGSEELSAFVFKSLYICFCIFIIFGFYSRIFSLLLLILQVALVKSSYYYSYGVDFFCSMTLLYLMLLPSDEYLSVRNLYRKAYEKTNFTFVKTTFRIHLAIAYFVSGAEKLSGYNWRNGESVWKAVHLPNFSNDFSINLDSLGGYPLLFVIMGWFTIVVELFYPLFMSLKKTRMSWLYLTISLHLGIAIMLNLYFFSAIMITWNIAAYYDFNRNKTA